MVFDECTVSATNTQLQDNPSVGYVRAWWHQWPTDLLASLSSEGRVI